MISCLKNKLIEEVNEYLEDESVEEYRGSGAIKFPFKTLSKFFIVMAVATIE